MQIIRRVAIALIIALGAILWLASPALAFCGFYVSQANSDLYNQASQVIIARDGDRTVLTMANDYQGDVQNFALVVPVPVLLTEEQVRVGDPTILERLDTFSAPRLVEYFDRNPCSTIPEIGDAAISTMGRSSLPPGSPSDEALGVTVESRFSVGEYDIVILSATESSGLETWLDRNGYQIPPQASQLLQPYIRQDMKFFVAKVNLEEFNASEYQSLRPLMMAFESPKFMLPIRLGTMNAQQEQDLIVYLLSPKGQIELTNYRMAQIPSDEEIPEFVEEEFGEFYKAMFQTSYEREQKKVAFLEYAWDMGWCDPCAANPLSREELQKAGVFWLEGASNPNSRLNPNANNVFITRLHVRYTRDKFPEDLQFQETGNRQNFQGRYIIRHP
ncbi:MAG: DUF2330 domain-containing protein, partial [Cyanobacteriota bacterium]|nr:DUF2330 domain-containing protein [Cyanobacteriota bacterium]